MFNNLYLGDNELVIVYRDGHHYVCEKYEDYNDVFDGSYEDCMHYCDERFVAYVDSLF